MDIGRFPSDSRENEDSALFVSAPSTTIMDEVDEDFVYSDRDQLGSSESQLSYIDPADVYKEFEIHRSSAEYYLDQYLTQLTRSYLDPDMPTTSQDLTTTSDLRENRDMIRLRNSHDSVTRDLLAMEAVLAHAKTLPNPPGRILRQPRPSGLCPLFNTVACTVSAFTIPLRIAASISAIGAVAGIIALTAPPAWNMYQDYSLDSARANVQQLRHNFQNDIGAIDDRSKDVLKSSQFKFLKTGFANL